jgi:hypothetical protein
LFTLTVSTNTAPYFMTKLVDQHVTAGEKLVYNLPNIVVEDGYKAGIHSVTSVPNIAFM